MSVSACRVDLSFSIVSAKRNLDVVLHVVVRVRTVFDDVLGAKGLRE